MNEESQKELEFSTFKSVSEWYETMRQSGYLVPGCMCAGIIRIMKKYSLTFSEAYKFLKDKEKIIISGRFFIYDLTGDDL